MKLLLITLSMALNMPLQAQQQEFSWLIGSWREDAGKYFETWRVKDDTLVGESYNIDPSGNKALSEMTKIFKRNGDFYFVADVAGPQGPVEFKVTSFGAGTFVAENPHHDFPEKIAYKRMDDLHLQAFVSGGNHRIIHFSFAKTK